MRSGNDKGRKNGVWYGIINGIILLVNRLKYSDCPKYFPIDFFFKLIFTLFSTLQIYHLQKDKVDPEGAGLKQHFHSICNF